MATVPAINPFAQVFRGQDIKPIQQAPAVTKKPTEETAAKRTELASASNTTGVNTNIGVGDSSFIPAQAGKPAGIGKTYAFA